MIKNCRSHIVFVLCMTYILLPSFQIYGAGLDESWVRYLAYGVDNKLLYGQDIIFTYGPFNPLWSNLYLSYKWLWLGLSCLIISTFVYAVTDVLGIKRACVFFAIFFTIKTPDPIFLFIIFTITYWILFKNHNRIVLGLLVCSISIIMQIKFTFAVCSLLIIGALFYKRNWKALIGMALLCLIEWYIVQGSYSNIWRYCVSSYHIADSYNWSMQLSNIDYFDESLAIIQFILLIMLTSYNLIVKKYLFAIITLIILFFGFKEGIVRADYFHLICFHQLSVLLIVFIILYYSKTSKRHLLQFLMAFLLLIIPIYYLYMVNMWHFSGASIRKNYFEHYQAGDPIAHNAFPSKLHGCVDLYPYNLSKLLDSGYHLCVRPVFQSYSAYDKTLLELNLEHLKSEKSPDNIFWNISPIDNRYPAQDDSISWPYIIANYSIISTVDDYLLLKRNIQPKYYKLNFISSQYDKKLGESIKVPNIGQLIWVTMDIKPTTTEKIKAVFYKPHKINLDVHYSDGSSKIFRLIPKIANAGFLLSPTIENIEEFSCLYIKDKEHIASDCGKRVMSFEVFTEQTKSKIFYNINSIKFSSLEFIDNQRVNL